MITWYSVTSEEFNAAPASSKSENKLFFLTDTLELYKGDKLYSKSVDFYENTIPTNPAINRLYIEKNTHEGRIWTGSEWIVVIQPIQLEVDVLNTTKPISGFAVFNYTDNNFIKYTELQELSNDQKILARKNIDGLIAPKTALLNQFIKVSEVDNNGNIIATEAVDEPDRDDALALVSEMGFITPCADKDGNIYTDKNGNIYIL